MDLKEFIKETIKSIVDSTLELRDDYEEQHVLINPPVAQSGSDVYSPGSENYTYRKISEVRFDVALTVGSETEGKGEAGIRVFSAQLGASGGHTKSTESVSRVQFAIPIALAPTSAEHENRMKREEAKRRSDEAIRSGRNRGGSWAT